MAKITNRPIEWDRSLPREVNLSNAINKYWGVDATNVAYGHLYSDMVCGVPAAYRDNKTLKHPDIVYLYRGANRELKIR